MPIGSIRIQIAEVKIEVEFLNCRTISLQKDYLSFFEEPDLIISVTSNDLAKERRIISIYGDDSVNCITTDSDEAVENHILHTRIANAMLSFDTFLMHGAVVAKDGYAYMFTASSGVGKTTRVRRWLDLYPDSIVVNGDKPFIKITDTQAIACGTPWCGKEGWSTNTMIPLRAIFLLERAEGEEETYIEEISLGQAFPFLLQQTYRPENSDQMRKTLSLLKSLEGKVKIYRFKSNPTAESVQLAYETVSASIKV